MVHPGLPSKTVEARKVPGGAMTTYGGEGERPTLPFREADLARRETIAAILHRVEMDLRHVLTDWDTHRRHGRVTIEITVADGVGQAVTIIPAARVRHQVPRRAG